MFTQLLAAALTFQTPGPCDSLPLALYEALHRVVPAAVLPVVTPADSIWGDYVGPNLQTDGHPFCVTGDFDGNGQPDYALVVVDSLGARILAFHLIGAAYHPHPMWMGAGEERRLSLPLHGMALFRSPPAVHMDMYESVPDYDSPLAFVTAENYESSSWEMVWDGKQYRTFWTSD